MSIIFDGKTFASQREEKLKEKVRVLKEKGITPCLASILVGDNQASKLYVGLKKKAAERVGIRLEVFDSIDEIERLNKDKSVHGIMIQLPLPPELQDSKFQILDSIAPEKDVDGLRSDTKFLHPTAKAVIDIMNHALSLVTGHRSLITDYRPLTTVCVIGERGMVGAPLVRELKRLGYTLVTRSEEADILVSCTGVPGLIKPEMVKKGAIVIDVGSPRGDVDPEVKEKAFFITPVPGGVGPVTITCLLENLIVACFSKI